MRELLRKIGFVYSPACEGAPIPNVPQPLKFGYNAVDRSDLAIAATPVANQPQECPLYYEFRFVLGKGNMMVNYKNESMTIVFPASTAKEMTAKRIVFRISGLESGDRRRLFENSKYHGTHLFQVRTMNGNGQVSNWSELRSSAVSFGEP